MLCVQCAAESNVINSRSENGLIKRRRECTQCLTRWNTYEIHADQCAVIIKNKSQQNKSCIFCNKLVHTWKFCLEHLNEYKRLDMRKRRAHYKKTGIAFPKMKKGPVIND